VAQISSDTRATADIIEGKLRNTGVELEQERERLANATSGAEDSDLGGLKMKMDMVSTLAKLRGTEPSDGRWVYIPGWQRQRRPASGGG
jgi:hypothetical protein